MIHELLGVVNEEAASVRLPRDDVRQTIAFHLVEHGVQLDGEGHRDASAAAVLLVLEIVLRIHFGIVRMIVVVVHHEVAFMVFGRLARLLRLAAAFGARLVRRGVRSVGLRRNSTGSKGRHFNFECGRLEVAQEPLRQAALTYIHL